MLVFRFLAKLCVAAGLLQAYMAFAQGSSPEKVSFYFAAHQDDWQLFMIRPPLWTSPRAAPKRFLCI